MSASSQRWSSSPLSKLRLLRPPPSMPSVPDVRPGPEATDMADAPRGPPSLPPTNILPHIASRTATRTVSPSARLGAPRSGCGSAADHPPDAAAPPLPPWLAAAPAWPVPDCSLLVVGMCVRLVLGREVD